MSASPIYEETDPLPVRREKLLAHVQRCLWSMKRVRFTSDGEFRKRVRFAYKCVGNLRRALGQ